MSQLQYNLQSPPKDGISSMKFSSHNDHLLVSSWDRNVYLYDTASNRLLQNYSHRGAALDCCFITASQSASVGLDQKVIIYDFARDNNVCLGTHSAGISKVRYYRERSMLVTGSWDKTIKIWDPTQSRPLIATLPQHGKVFAMDVNSTRLVVAHSTKTISVYDLRKFDKPEQERQSLLRHQIRTLATSNDQTGFAVGSIEGRIAIELFDNQKEKKDNQKVGLQNFAFKCHRDTSSKPVLIYPVNSIAFQPQSQIFASGGGDNIVNIWNPINKKRIFQIRDFPTSISSVAWNKTGQFLAIASSYTYERGDIEHPPDSIIIKKMN
ncbi:mitotic checkpoint protein bub3 [Anaeramoeba flamelloides]|uniref:Mitotic checkpoint protein bub3 n=1 Tax=Anaeramoeba flamelloides TaxID=1746091 RepID=A0AAV7ZC86_9EUKA|nr:mitotic checkpoint protein bub3 [Anaeramoeba flamelloides]